MPHDLVTLRQDVLLKDRFGGNDRVVLTKYEAPSTPDGAVAFDSLHDLDLAIARRMMEWLEEKYPGHLWATRSDYAQGVVMFNIPILMGMDEWYLINLKTHTPAQGLKQGSGQILERYRLKRDRFDVDSFLEAREQHSRLVNPRRAIPT